MRIVTAHADIYVEEIHPRPVVMQKDSANVLVQRTQVKGPWGTIVVDQFSNGTMQAVAIVDNHAPAKRSTSEALEIRPTL